MSRNRQELNVLFNEALNQYKEFLLNNTPTDSRSFVEHQSACKAALAHLLLLDRLSRDERNAGGPDLTYREESLEELLRESIGALEAESKIMDE